MARKYSPNSYSHERKTIGHLYESDSSISQKSLENFDHNGKSQTLTALITQSGQYDVIAVTDSSSKSDGYASQSSTSGPPPIMQRSSKRSQRRRKLKELNKT
ncbi:uncharacterized protein [Parasteatoda tepidariorum]|uniref:uncharacterized protein n=1 Tax=Parasteatoda tepidariorum TaxID=114398 RepID=UPI001C71B194|nr:uncharacterized protein LOC122268332 [Parasteatoda tepidariorum]